MSKWWPSKWFKRDNRGGYVVTPKASNLAPPNLTVTPSTPAPEKPARPNKRNLSPVRTASDDMASVFSGIPLKRNSGNQPDVKAEDALKDKVVALYFSAHWCPPCRQFTPVLKDFYEEVSENNPLEIVFVSFDRSAEDMKKYLEEAHGEWLYIPQGDPNIKALSEKYGVQGIPALIVIKQDGSVANPNGRADVQKGPAQFASWKAACGI